MKPAEPIRMTASSEVVSAGALEPAPAALSRAQRFYAWLERVLSARHAALWISVLAGLGVSSALTVPFAADDHIHLLSLRGSPGIEGFERAFYDLFRFADARVNALMLDVGVFPWWSDATSHLAFFRPLTSLTHALDHWLFPGSSVAAHLQSIAWFLLGVWGLHALYSRLIQPAWAANLALVFYALDDARGGPVSWIANRNALVASALSIWALVFYQRGRSGELKAGSWLAPLTFAVALTAGEGAISICGYLAAYAFFLDDGSYKQRFLRLWPFAVVVVLWRAGSMAFGAGSWGSGVYLDPIREPVAFLQALPTRVIALFLGQVAGPWSEMWNAAALASPLLEMGFLLFGVMVTGWVAYLLKPLWKANKVVPFFVMGSVLSTLPACATFPADRLLGWLAIGASGAMAILFSHLVKPESMGTIWTGSPRVPQLTALAVVGFHLVLGPLTLPWRAQGAHDIRKLLDRVNGSLPMSPEIREQTFIYVNPPADPLACYIPIMRAELGQPRAKAQRWLGNGHSELELERLDERTLRVRQAAGYLAAPTEQMLRSRANHFELGDTVTLNGMRATITEMTPDQRPLEVRFEFDVPLEDASLRWFFWSGDRYADFKLPKVHQRITLPKADFIRVAYGDG